MANVLTFLAPGFEEVEMLTVVDLLRRSDITIDMVSITDSLDVPSSHNVIIKADKLFSEADFDEAEMIVLPGGMPGTLNLIAYQPLTEKLIEFDKKGKGLAAVCAAPSILGTLNILKGHKATCYPGYEDKLTDAIYVKQPVVVDDNIITGRGMGVCIDFAGAIIEYFYDSSKSDEIKTKIIYNDNY